MEILQKRLELEAPTPFSGNTYLGCTQEDTEPDKELIQEKQILFDKLLRRVDNKVDTQPEEKEEKIPKQKKQQGIKERRLRKRMHQKRQNSPKR